MNRTAAIVWSSFALFGAASARPGGPTPVRPTRMVPLTRGTIAREFPDKHSAAELVALAKQRQWKPSQNWIATEGKRYGRLLIVSDLHPGPGTDPLTGKVHPVEAFMRDRQEIDFRNMLTKEWQSSRADGRVRTLVLNGDVFEFMQVTTAPEGQKFTGGKDQYGPLNTPRNIITKLREIWEGHPDMFKAYAEHLVNGHRIVLLPGNHDRQLVHPAVRAALRSILKTEVARAIGADPTFQPALTGEARHVAAIHQARTVLEERFELHPHFFMVGDVFVRHGNQNDHSNSFSTMLGDFYAHPLKRDQPMEAALGDYFVKAVFNTVNAKIPWGKSEDNKLMVAHEALKKDHGRLFSAAKLLKAFVYIMTREGHGTPRDVTAQKVKEEEDLVRLVRQYGMVEKFNHLREGKAPLAEREVVDLLLEYQSKQAEPLLNTFQRGTGLVHRAFTALRRLPSLIKKIRGSAEQYEQAGNHFLFDQVGIKTVATGHDHLFRLERFVVGEPGKERLGQVLDDATWLDAHPSPKARTVLAQLPERRGVIAVDFDGAGSHSTLNHWDPVRHELLPVTVLEDMEEALGKK